MVDLTTKTESKSTELMLVVIIVLTSFATYFNALFNGFVFDDIPQVVENRWIKDVKYIPEILTQNVWAFRGESTNFYRPLMHIIYMITYYIFGLKPWGFHFVNILLHSGVSALVFLIASQLSKGSKPQAYGAYLSPPFIAAILFATCPIHTEAVAWISGVPDLSFTFFCLLSFFFYIRSEDSKGCYLLSVVTFFLATLCKEPALTLPIILLVYDYAFRKKAWLAIDFLKRYFGYFIAAGAYFTLRFFALGGFAPVKGSAELSTYQCIINIFPLFSQYLRKLLLPVNLNAFYVFHPAASIFRAEGLLTLSITVAFIVFTCLMAKKSKVAFLSLLLIAVPLLPVLYLPAVTQEIFPVFAERYLYLPSLGFVLLIALFLSWERVSFLRAKVMIVAVVLALIGLYFVATVTRNAVWEDNYTLWADTIRKSSDSASVHNNLGMAYEEKGAIDQAIKHFKIAVSLQPDQPRFHNNLGMTYEALGLLEKAIEHYDIALKLRPDFAEAHNNLGVAFAKKKWMAQAIRQFQITVTLNPYLADAHDNLGIAYMEAGLIGEAIKHFEVATRLNPDNLKYRKDLSMAYGLKSPSH
jgi:protein O-mannosyl-transferase